MYLHASNCYCNEVPVADERVWGKNGEIMQIWWEKNEVFREKHEQEQRFPPQVSQPLTCNSTIPRYL
jgi:hypothetical protein